MCGICGFIDLDPTLYGKERAITESMLDTLVRRGPDEFGIHLIPGGAFAMRRLAVIDPQGGHQPIIDETTGVVLVYNGELYNYKTLRSQLIQKGHQFKSESDSEVVLRAYIEWGRGFVSRFNGMFAIAILDPRNGQMHLARDHLGQKPLYYWRSNKGLAFGSSLHTLLRHPEVEFELNTNAIIDYLNYQQQYFLMKILTLIIASYKVAFYL